MKFLVQNTERVVSRQELLDSVQGEMSNLPTVLIHPQSSI
jgi:DNA-binding winged helix-turn-helix (wHTH) protein